MTDMKRKTIAFVLGFGFFASSLFIEHYGQYLPHWLVTITYPVSLLLGVTMFEGPIGLVLLALLPVAYTALLYWSIGLFVDRSIEADFPVSVENAKAMVMTDSDWRSILKENRIPLAFFLLALLSGIAFLFYLRPEGTSPSSKSGFRNPHFSADGKYVAFDMCSYKTCENTIYDIEANAFTKLVDRKGRNIQNLSFSPDGDSILFSAITKPFWPWGKFSQQLAIGKRTESRFNLITMGDGLKAYPTFSGDNTLLYWGVNELPAKQGGGTYTEKQLTELDIKSKQTRILLPTEFNFYGPSAPYSLGDGDGVITADYGFHQPRKNYEDWLKEKKQNELLVISKNKQTVTPFVTGVLDSNNPRIIRQTRQIVFTGRLEKNEGQRGYAYEVFLYNPEGSTRLTTFRTYMMGMDVTADGKNSGSGSQKY